MSSDEFRRRWDEVQSTFVDEPRRAVEEADALQRYRSFFNRLLST